MLSTYKNQEYPEKLLQIKTLQKQVLDLHNVHAEEKEELTDMINKETTRLAKIQLDAEKDYIQNVFDVNLLQLLQFNTQFLIFYGLLSEI